jgi:GAF domain-containing protein
VSSLNDLRLEQQAALRRIATIVAGGTSAGEVFAAVVAEAAQVLAVPKVILARYESDRTATVVASLNQPTFTVGARLPLDGPSVVAAVLDTGRAARVDDYEGLPGTIAARVGDDAMHSTVGVPIAVDRRVWGVMTVSIESDAPLPADTEERLGDFAELVGIAITNTESREQLRGLADEQAALREIATLVASGAAPEELFPAIAEEVARVHGLPQVEMVRYTGDRTATVVAASGDYSYPPGSTWALDGPSVLESVVRTGGPARLDGFENLPGTVAETARNAGIDSAIGAPIVVGGVTWGAIVAGAKTIPEGAEQRLALFTELVAAAISNAQANGDLHEIASEQAALRRVATLVAEGTAPGELFAAVAGEVAAVLGVSSASVSRFLPDAHSIVLASLNDPGFPVGSRWRPDKGTLNATILETGRPVRIDQSAMSGPIAEASQVSGVRSVVAAPIVVEGAVWGMVAVGRQHSDEPLPAETESRLTDFTELVATAISNAEARDSERRLGEEQAALRRVATLVARAAPSTEVFDTVAVEVGKLFETDITVVGRYDADGFATAIGNWSASGTGVPVGTRSAVGGRNVLTLVAETGKPARIDGYEDASGEAAEIARRFGWQSSIAAPIVVGGRTWGVMLVATERVERFPEGAEERLAAFTDLVATAVSNAEAHDELHEIASEQAALRRVATLVARGASADELFTGVASEVQQVLNVSAALLDRYEPDGSAIMLAASHDPDWAAAASTLRKGMRWPHDPGSLTALVQETGRAARIADNSRLTGEVGETSRAAGIGPGYAAPIVVDGTLWGAIRVFSRQGDELPTETETRLEGFTELVGTAISNAQSHDDLRDLADEQAALRRLATRVAEGAEPTSIFDAVCAETGRLLSGMIINLSHYTPEGINVTMAGWSVQDSHVPVGTRFPITPDTVGGKIVQTGAPVRIESWDNPQSELGELVRKRGIRSSVGTPIVVEGVLWGALVAATDKDEPLPPETELRLSRFTELVATAISNAANRTELVASRARIVAAGDEARRKIERNLHDGTQQRLLAIGLDVQRIRGSLSPGESPVREGLERVERDLESVLEDVRELSRGLHPMLSRRGLPPALRALARRSPIPVEVELDLDERLPGAIETTVYYVVSEALTNAIKYSDASLISLSVATDHGGGPFAVSLDGRRADALLYVTIADDGSGGADASLGSGLTGLRDRVDVLGGRLTVDSPAGGGTRVSAVLPLVPPVEA